GLVADGGNGRDGAGGGGAYRGLVVEPPEVFQRAAAARDDENVRTRDGAAGRECIEAPDGGGDFRGAGLALDAHRPDEDMARKAVREPMENVADHRAGRRGDDAHDRG